MLYAVWWPLLGNNRLQGELFQFFLEGEKACLAPRAAGLELVEVWIVIYSENMKMFAYL